MNKYELYIFDNGRLHPTGIWTRGHRIGQIDDRFRKDIKKIGKPCAILVSTLIPGVNDN